MANVTVAAKFKNYAAIRATCERLGASILACDEFLVITMLDCKTRLVIHTPTGDYVGSDPRWSDDIDHHRFEQFRQCYVLEIVMAEAFKHVGSTVQEEHRDDGTTVYMIRVKT